MSKPATPATTSRLDDVLAKFDEIAGFERSASKPMEDAAKEITIAIETHQAYVAIEAMRVIQQNCELDALELLASLEAISVLERMLAPVLTLLEEAKRQEIPVKLSTEKTLAIEKVSNLLRKFKGELELQRQNPVLAPIIAATEAVRNQIKAILLAEQNLKTVVNHNGSAFNNVALGLPEGSHDHLGKYYSTLAANTEIKDPQGEAKLAEISSLLNLITSGPALNHNFAKGEVVPRAMFSTMKNISARDGMSLGKNLQTLADFEEEGIIDDAMSEFIRAAEIEEKLLKEAEEYVNKPVPSRGGIASRIFQGESEEFITWSDEGSTLRRDIETKSNMKKVFSITEPKDTPDDRAFIDGVRDHLESCAKVYRRMAEACALLKDLVFGESAYLPKLATNLKYTQIAAVFTDFNSFREKVAAGENP